MKRKLGIVQKLHHLTWSERGGALAELAIVVPFLAVMLAGVSEFGRFFQNYTTLAKATRSAARYLSNHDVTKVIELNRAKSLVVCGKLTCAGGDELVKGFSVNNVCLEQIPADGVPKVINVTVRIPHTSGGGSDDCNPMPNSGAAAVPYNYTPIFNIGALLHDNSFSMALPMSPRTTMFYMID